MISFLKNIINPQDKVVKLSERDRYLEWCKNCNKSKFDVEKGLTCSLTGNLASFGNTCHDYNANVDLIRKNIIETYQKDEQTDSIIELKSSKSQEKKSLLQNDVIIKNKRFPSIIYFIMILDLMYLIFVYYFIEQEKQFNLILLMLIGSVFPIGLFIKKGLDQTPKLRLGKKELIVKNQTIKYCDILVFTLERGKSETGENMLISKKVLILRDIKSATNIEIDFSGLNYKFKEISNLIAARKALQ